MTRAVVMGAGGFIGRNLVVALERREGVAVVGCDVGTDAASVEGTLEQADVIFHLAGVNRPPNPEDFEAGNAGVTKGLCDRLRALDRRPVIVFSSSTQAELDNPYGRSKRAAEEVLKEWASAAGGTVAVFRLPNVFGKWCRPNYNSAVATFCNNIARGLPIVVSDPDRELELVYVDDVVEVLSSFLNARPEPGTSFPVVTPTFKVRLGEIAETLNAFKASRKSLEVPDFSDSFITRLYATYLSYLPEGEFAYALQRNDDARGTLAELLKAPSFGQLFVSRTKRGVTRGNHYHDTKTEKFCVLEGEAVIRFRPVLGCEVQSYRVSGNEFRVVDIPPGYAHSIENVGENELVVLFWASEVFDPSKPGAYPCGVVHD